jgi:glycosyltransferase involved in cell wall biosynthesis
MSLPIHFFTIVLDGEPYIRYHLNVLKSLSIPWHWHIVEGVAELKHDTSWSLATGGRIPENRYTNGRSSDGTSAYLDQIAKENPAQITIYRKPLGQSWDGKIEMVRAPLASVSEPCLLWQIDSDELWTAKQIEAAHFMFIKEPHRHAAYFWCHYFIGPDKVIATRNCYAQNPNQEWLRVWRYQPGMEWVAHEPPVLAVKALDGNQYNVASINPFTHQETEAAGLVFQHMSYTTEAQVRFKEQYYGYAGAVDKWRALQADPGPYTLLRNYFPWVSDSTLVESASRHGVKPLMTPSLNPSAMTNKAGNNTEIIILDSKPPRLAIDGVFFQLNTTGIARVWSSILQCWSDSGYLSEVLLLDRAGTMPKFTDGQYKTIPAYTVGQGDADRRLLQNILDAEGVSLFASTYYTSPVNHKTLQMVYDMIPEVFNYNIRTEPAFIEKHHAFSHADYFTCISEHTRADLHRFFPEISQELSEVIYCGVDPKRFNPASASEINTFRHRHALTKPYFVMVGHGGGYKNQKMAVEALSSLCSAQGFELLIATGGPIAGELAPAIQNGTARAINLNDAELRVAYSGAVALIYPSLYEGFGLPVLEAMACGCPVISNNKASLPEVCGDAALYAQNKSELALAICEVQKPTTRARLIDAGSRRVELFSWETCAQKLWSRVTNLTGEDATLLPTHLENNLSRDIL